MPDAGLIILEAPDMMMPDAGLIIFEEFLFDDARSSKVSKSFTHSMTI